MVYIGVTPIVRDGLVLSINLPAGVDVYMESNSRYYISKLNNNTIYWLKNSITWEKDFPVDSFSQKVISNWRNKAFPPIIK